MTDSIGTPALKTPKDTNSPDLSGRNLLFSLCSHKGISMNAKCLHRFERRSRPQPTKGAFGKKPQKTQKT